MEPPSSPSYDQVIDAHSHLHEDTNKIRNFLSKRMQVQQVCLCSATVKEWDFVYKLKLEFPNRVIPCFGVHPWNAHTVQAGDLTWQTSLHELLASCPNAILGEVGVDKVRKNVEFGNTFQSGQQQLVFEAQVNIACQLNKPMNVHCVQAHGWLFDFFRKFSKDKTKVLPPVLWHSYTGSADMVTGIIKIPKIGKKFYFSFSSAINLNNDSKKLDAAVAAVPEDRLLIESDWHRVDNQYNSIKEIVAFISKIRNWTEQETIEITTRNAIEFFSYNGDLVL